MIRIDGYGRTVTAQSVAHGPYAKPTLGWAWERGINPGLNPGFPIPWFPGRGVGGGRRVAYSGTSPDPLSSHDPYPRQNEKRVHIFKILLMIELL